MDMPSKTYLVPEEVARNVDELSTHNGHLLAREDLLGNDRGEATEKVALAVDNVRGSLLKRHGK